MTVIWCIFRTAKGRSLPDIKGGCEETTTVLRLKAREREGFKFPMIAVNDAYCKHLTTGTVQASRYGTEL